MLSSSLVMCSCGIWLKGFGRKGYIPKIHPFEALITLDVNPGPNTSDNICVSTCLICSLHVMEREVHVKLSVSILLNTSALDLFCLPGNMFPSDISVYLIRPIVFSGENFE